MRIACIFSIFLLLLCAGAVTAQDDAREVTNKNQLSFTTSLVNLDLQGPKTLSVILSIMRQTGNKVPFNKKLKNERLPAFKATGETFWQVMDRLGRDTGNVYTWAERSG